MGMVALGISAVALSIILLVVVPLFFAGWRSVRSFYWGLWFLGFGTSINPWVLDSADFDDDPKPAFLRLGARPEGRETTEREDRRTLSSRLRLHVLVSIVSVVAAFPSVVSVTLVQITTSLPVWKAILLCNLPIGTLITALIVTKREAAASARAANDEERRLVEEAESLVADRSDLEDIWMDEAVEEITSWWW